MSTYIEHLAARIGDTLSTDTANMPPWLWRPLRSAWLPHKTGQ